MVFVLLRHHIWEMSTWLEMELLGWRWGFDEFTKIIFFPLGQKVQQKRNLTHQEKIDFGDVLFPGKVKFAKKKSQ